MGILLEDEALSLFRICTLTCNCTSPIRVEGLTAVPRVLMFTEDF